jgi:hypothetical protein
MSAVHNPAWRNTTPTPHENVDEALELMERALALIDAAGGPDDAGAHLDLAIHRLKAWVDGARG